MTLVEAALARPPAEREAYLQSACPADPALYEEVRNRIEWEERMGGFLRDPIVPPPAVAAAPERLGPQSSIGHYRITAKLGRGGMGEVWRAIDTKLNREVAVKVIPASLAADRERMIRFQREARVLASLNHPNIAAIYGVEERALVMELVEGERLAGPLSVEQAMPLIHQLIDALEWAHEKGIVHRDLKPANIKVTPEGRIKVLDFGLAKAISQDAASSDSRFPSAITELGAIIGSPAYMAPEQAGGEKVDKRADIWSFGVVVYEMLTGRKLFSGETVSEILAQLTTEPDFASVPPRFRRLLDRCLRRDPRKRLHNIGHARALLEESALEQASWARRPWTLLLAAILALTIGLFAGLLLRTAPAAAPRFHFTIETRGPCYLSPNGRHIIQSTSRGISIRSLDNTVWRLLPETESAADPFWSPDSSTIGFFSGGRLMISSVSGGSPRNLAAAPEASGGAWRGAVNDGMILFASAGAFHVLDISSGQVRDLALKFSAGQRPINPVFLPEGDGFLYLIAAADKTALFRSTLGSASANGEFLLDTRRAALGRHPRTRQSYLFYAGPDGALLARPVHPQKGTFTGPPVRILGSLSHGAFDVAQSGMITWHSNATSQPIWRIRWFDRTGVVTSAIGDLGTYVSLALSPDESKLAVLQGSPIEHIWLYNLRNGAAARASARPGNEGNPVWSPDSQTLYYTVGTEAGQQVVRQEIASGSQPEILYESRDPRPLVLQDITPDGKYLIAIRMGQGPETGIFRLDVADRATPRALHALRPNGDASQVRISPGGHSLVFVTAGAVFASRHPPSGQPRQIGSFRGGSYPFFSRDGQTLYFIAERSVISQPVLQTPGGEMRLGERSVLFPITSGTRTTANLGAVSRDGNRVIVISTDDDDELGTHVLSDWTALLKD